MTALERQIELKGVRWLQKQHVFSVKHGKQGWPDRQVLLGGGRHFWWEVKRTRYGRLTPAQKVVIEALRARGDIVVVGDAVMMAETFNAYSR